jgi:hypothetical protein
MRDRTEDRGRAASALAAALAAAWIPGLAATYIVPPDDALIAKAEVIVRGRVLDAWSEEEGSGAIHTDARVEVERVLKGGSVPATVLVRSPGGIAGDRMMVVPGIGAPAPGEEVLLMLEAGPEGVFRLTDFALGKFRVSRRADGVEVLRRDGLRGALVLGRPGAPREEPSADPDRDAAAFERYVEETLRGGSPPADYVLPEAAGAGEDEPDTAFAEFEFLSSPPARWIEFGTGGTITYRDNAAGDAGGNCPTGCHTETANGVIAWNSAPITRIALAYGGTDASIGSKCLEDLDNEIQFNDPCGQMNDLNRCAGALALGGFFSSGTGGGTFCPAKGSPAFGRIAKGFVLINNGVGSCLNSCNYEDMVAHEVGHSIGAGHSFVPGALMGPTLVPGRCGVLQPDDVAFAQCVYPGAAGSCTGPLVTGATARFRRGIWRAAVAGTGFRKGTIVEIDAGSGFVAAPRTVFRTRRKVVGRDVETIWPAGPLVSVRVVSPAGCPSNAVFAGR